MKYFQTYENFKPRKTAGRDEEARQKGLRPQHIVTEEDNVKLNAYFAKEDGEDHVPFNVVGKTLKAASKEIGDDFHEEWLQHMLCVLFPKEFTPDSFY